MFKIVSVSVLMIALGLFMGGCELEEETPDSATPGVSDSAECYEPNGLYKPGPNCP